ncbi:Permease of the drug/metabolite transporter (DMT) superfamily [Lachnospiraceae bacterium C7]|nr:Permease of the drug/metabolite transporter (DMT) superfamily [Lachnospiraceae bacterium C7]
MNKEKFFTKNVVVLFGALICCALWGSAFPCIKLGYKTMGIAANNTPAQMLYAGFRFFLAGVFTILIGSVLQKKVLLPKKESIKKILILCMLQTVLQYIFFYIGLAHTAGVKASIIEGVNVFVAIIVSAGLFKMEKVTSKKIVGCLIGFAGVVIVNLAGNSLDFNMSFNGEGFIFLSTVAYAFSSVFLKRYSRTENPVTLSGYQFALGGLIMVAVALGMGANLSEIKVDGLGILIYLALVSAVAYSLWGILLKYNDVSKVTIFGFMNPVFGVFLSAILLQEKDLIGINCIVALVLVSIGIYLSVSASKERKENE